MREIVAPGLSGAVQVGRLVNEAKEYAMQQTELAMSAQRYFAPGEPVRVVVACEFGRADKTVQVLLRHLENGGIEVLDVLELTVRAPEPMPALLLRKVCDPKPANAQHGPQRKGAGGKVRRW